MSDRIVHLVEVAVDSKMRYIATVNRFNNIVHGAAQPEDQLNQALPLQGKIRRYIELKVEQDSDEAGPAFRPGKYTATIDEHNIIVHGAARSDDRAGISSSPIDHATSPLELLETSRGDRHAKVLSTSEDEDSDSDSTAERKVDASKHGSTRGIAERVKTANTYINRRQKSAISRPGPDAEGKFIVEKLLAQIRNPDDENDPKMLVKWEGYGLEEATYELRSALLEDAPAEVRRFDARQSRLSDERSLSPLNPQSWPTGLSETAFRDLDVASQDVNAAAASEASHSVVVKVEDSDSDDDDDDAPIPRRRSKTATSSHMRSPLQPKSAALQRTRDQSPDSIFDGPTPDPSFWTASPEPRTITPQPFAKPKPDRETPGLFVTPGPEPTLARRAADLPARQPARARLGEGYSVPGGTRTNKPDSRARAGLGFDRSNLGGEASSTSLTPGLNSNATADQPDHRILPTSNKRKEVRPARPISPKRPKFYGLE